MNEPEKFIDNSMGKLKDKNKKKKTLKTIFMPTSNNQIIKELVRGGHYVHYITSRKLSVIYCFVMVKYTAQTPARMTVTEGIGIKYGEVFGVLYHKKCLYNPQYIQFQLI